MSSILFGSIGSIADTSELQRQSFNQAFERHKLDWHWSESEYSAMLKKSGGMQRIKDYAASLGQSVDAAAIHESKSQIFQEYLQAGKIKPRPGVVEIIAQTKQHGFKLGLVTTTSQKNVSSLLFGLESDIQRTDFDLVVNVSMVERSKPAVDAYALTLKKLNEKAENCVAIEDNLDGVSAAKAAGISCVAFPGENNAHYDFSKADLRVDKLDFDELKKFMALLN